MASCGHIVGSLTAESAGVSARRPSRPSRTGDKSPEKADLPVVFGENGLTDRALESFVDLSRFPGGDLVAKGLEDLARSDETPEAFLVSIGAARLRECGLGVAVVIPDAEHRLYERLASDDPDSAHSRYNALLRRLTSLEIALECVS